MTDRFAMAGAPARVSTATVAAARRRPRAGFAASIVIPTRQRCALLRRALHALGRQACAADRFEIVVAVDRSDDGTVELVQTWQGPIAITCLASPGAGRAAACNAGVEAASGDLVILLDDDMEPEPGFVDAHIRAHGECDDLAVIGAVPIRVAPGSSEVARYIQARYAIHLERLSRPHRVPRLREFFTGNFSIRRDRFLHVGGFDDRFREYGHEDLELWVRLSDAGTRLAYAADALAWQSYTKDMRELARDAQAEGRTAVQLARRHPHVETQLKLGTWDEGPVALRLLRRLLLAADARSHRVGDGLLAATRWLEDVAPRRALHAWYPLAHGFFFWRGVRDALAERGLNRAWPPRRGRRVGAMR